MQHVYFCKYLRKFKLLQKIAIFFVAHIIQQIFEYFLGNFMQILKRKFLEHIFLQGLFTWGNENGVGRRACELMVMSMGKWGSGREPEVVGLSYVPGIVGRGRELGVPS